MDHAAHIGRLGPAFLEFWKYWDSLKKTNHVPQLSDYLDRAPTTLQPNVVAMDLHAEDGLRVRLLGTAIADVIGEMTGSAARTLYNNQTRSTAIHMARTAMDHPCGYVAKRMLMSKQRHLFETFGLVLPVHTQTSDSDLGTVISYTELPSKTSGLAQDDQIEAVQDLADRQWIDIGAGVPG